MHGRRAGALTLVVLEEHVRLVPRQCLQLRRPLGQLGHSVVELVQARVTPARSCYYRRRKLRLFRDAQCDVACTQRVEHIIAEPALVTELYGELSIEGQAIE